MSVERTRAMLPMEGELGERSQGAGPARVRRMRVLHVEVGGSYGGSLRALETYLAHSERTDVIHDVLLYYPTPRTERIRSLVGRLRILLDGTRLPASIASGNESSGRVGKTLKRYLPPRVVFELADWLTFMKALPFVSRLRKELRAGRYDVVHVNNTPTYQMATLLAAKLAKIRILAHIRNPIKKTAISRRMIRLADCLITVNKSFEKNIGEWVAPVTVATCHDAVEAPVFDPSLVSQLRASHIGPGETLIGSVGRLDTQKGYEYLIRAARQVLDVRPNVRFAIAGEGPLRPSLQKLIEQLGLEGRFYLCGFKQDIAIFVSALDLFVSSSIWEGLPLAIVEALLLKKPVIATNIDGNSEVIIPGRTGTLVRAGDPNALAGAILEFLGKRVSVESYVEEGFKLAASFADPKAYAQRMDQYIIQSKPITDQPNVPSNSQIRNFYEQSYNTRAWRRKGNTGKAIEDSRFIKMWYRSLIDHILPHVPLRNKRVLEIGCGYGSLIPHFYDSGAQYIGVDIALNAVRQCPRHNGSDAHGVVADAVCLPFPDRSFDLLLCMEVLEHAPNPIPILRECFRVIRPEGNLIFSCPNYFNLFAVPKFLSDLGVPYFCRYMRRQIVDRNTTAFELRRQLSRYGIVLIQRGVRLHPPFFEQLDYRLSPKNWLRRINDLVFAIESAWGDRVPWNCLGLHTLYLVKPRGQAEVGVPRKRKLKST